MERETTQTPGQVGVRPGNRPHACGPGQSPARQGTRPAGGAQDSGATLARTRGALRPHLTSRGFMAWQQEVLWEPGGPDSRPGRRQLCPGWPRGARTPTGHRDDVSPGRTDPAPSTSRGPPPLFLREAHPKTLRPRGAPVGGGGGERAPRFPGGEQAGERRGPSALRGARGAGCPPTGPEDTACRPGPSTRLAVAQDRVTCCSGKFETFSTVPPRPCPLPPLFSLRGGLSDRTVLAEITRARLWAAQRASLLRWRGPAAPHPRGPVAPGRFWLQRGFPSSQPALRPARTPHRGMSAVPSRAAASRPGTQPARALGPPDPTPLAGGPRAGRPPCPRWGESEPPPGTPQAHGLLRLGHPWRPER